MNTEAVSATPVRSGQLWPLSIEAYHVLGEAGLLPKNTELLYGLVYKKVRKAPYHSYLAGLLWKVVEAGIPGGMHVRCELPIECGDSEPEPDISVVAGEPDDYMRAHPSTAELVIEVCATSHEYDRSKLRAYATANVKECWVVLGPEKRVEVYLTPSNGSYLKMCECGPDEGVASKSITGLRVDLKQLFRDL